MPKRMTVLLALIGLAATRAPAQDASSEGGGTEPSAEMKARAEACTDRKFETIVALPGRDTGSKVRICGNQGQSDAEWIATLKDSILKAEANDEMDQEVKAQIIEALKAEIARLEEAETAPPVATIVDRGVTEGPVAVREPDPQYSTLPSLPKPKAPAAVSLAGPKGTSANGSPAAPIRPAVVPPRLTIRCALPGETYSECTGLEMQTRLAVRAGEDLAPGTSLRFRRGDKVRSELDLGGLKEGQSLNRKLPGIVCMGVMRGKVWLEIVSKGQVADSLGPYPLTCGT